MKRFSRWIVPALFAALSVSSAAAQQQSNIDAAAFPNRAIKVVVPFPAGGPSEVLARIIGQRMSEDWGQPVLIENRVGANTVITYDANDAVTLNGVMASHLTASNFKFT